MARKQPFRWQAHACGRPISFGEFYFDAHRYAHPASRREKAALRSVLEPLGLQRLEDTNDLDMDELVESTLCCRLKAGRDPHLEQAVLKLHHPLWEA